MATRKRVVEVIEDDPAELFEQAEAAILRAIIESVNDDAGYNVKELCEAYRLLEGGGY